MTKLMIWNVASATPKTPRGRLVAELLARQDADILVVTEGCEAILPVGGHVIASVPDYGYAMKPGRRKVLLWSRQPWANVDAVGHPDMPVVSKNRNDLHQASVGDRKSLYATPRW